MNVAGRPSPRARLAAHGLRTTQPRVALLTALAEARAPLTVAGLHAALLPSGLDRATIWRNLAVLSARGVIERTVPDDGAARFSLPEIRQSGRAAMLRCTACGASERLPSRAIVVDLSYTGEIGAIDVIGRCRPCRGLTASSA